MAQIVDASSEVLITGYTGRPDTISLACWIKSSGFSDLGRIFDKTASDLVLWGYYYTAYDRFYIEADWTSYGSWYWDASSPNMDDGSWHHFALTYDGSSTANDPIVYIDGSSVTVTEENTPSGSWSSDSDAWTWANREIEGRQLTGSVAECAIWSRILTAAEVASLGDGYSPLFISYGLESYCDYIRGYSDRVAGGGSAGGSPTVTDHPPMIYPATPIIITSPAGVTEYSLTCESGSFSLTGQTAGTLKDSKVSIDPGSFNLAGQTAGTLKDSKLGIGSGSFGLTGQTAGTLKDSKLGADSGSFGLTGQTAGTLKDSKIPIGAGAHAITGKDADLFKGQKMAADAGSYDLAGQIVALLKSGRLSVEPGAYELTGLDADLIYTESRGVYLPLLRRRRR